MKKYLTFLILTVLLVSLLTVTVSAEDIADPYTGTCGGSITWTFDPETGALSLEGHGAMQNYYKQYNEYAPWYDFRTEVKSVTVSEGVSTIGLYAFYQCGNLTSVSLPTTLRGIAGAAFCGCSSLTEIVIPEGVTLIESDAFTNCTSLREVTLPNTLERLEYYAFYSCAIERITLPSSLLAIEFSAFYGCNALQSLNIPKNVVEIGSNVISNPTKEVYVSSPYYAELLRSGDKDRTAISKHASTLYFDADLGEIESTHLAAFTYRYTVEVDGILYNAYSKVAHTHVFDQTDVEEKYLAIEAACDRKASYYYSCICGEAGDSSFEYGALLGHSYSDVLTHDGEQHWYPCTVCGDRKNAEAHQYDTVCDKTCNVCTFERATGHAHVVEWEKDENGHWMTCYNCRERLYEGAHTASGDFSSDAEGHWTFCGVCEARMSASAHADANRDGRCDACSAVVSGGSEEDSETQPPMTEITETTASEEESSRSEDVTSTPEESESTPEPEEGTTDAGCGSVISMSGTLLLVGAAIVATVTLKKKEYKM